MSMRERSYARRASCDSTASTATAVGSNSTRRVDVAVGEHLRHAEVLQPAHRGRHLGARQTRVGVDEVGRLDRLLVRLQLARDALDVLHLERDDARSEAHRADVVRAVEQHRARRLPIASRPADLLVVGVDRRARLGVEDPADVVLVDAHAERDRRHHDARLAAHERVLRRVAHAPREPRVVRRRGDAPRAERRSQLLRAPPRRGVDDARTARRPRRPAASSSSCVRASTCALTARWISGRSKPRTSTARVAHPQPLDDLLAHGRRRRRGQRQHLGRPSSAANAPSRR